MPAGSAARPRHPPPPQPGEAATSGRAGAGPAAPSRAPGPAECVAAPAGGYFEREGSGPTSVFSAFSWPPARPPPARALGCPRSGRGGSRGRGEEEGRRDPARAPAPVQAREAPGGSRDLRSRPGRSGGIINSALGSGGGCGAPATCTPLLGRALTAWALPPQRRTQASLDSATVPQWPITGLDFLTCKLGMCHLALYSGTK